MTLDTTFGEGIAPPSHAPWTLEVLGVPACAFHVFGTPGPQGSKNARAIYAGKGADRAFTGRVAMHESSKKVAPWREAVKWQGRAAYGTQPLLEGPLVVDMVFTLLRPQSAPKRVRARPAKLPDLDKLMRATGDALTGIVYTDDSRIIGARRLEKVYANDIDPDALALPGAIIRVWQVSL